MTNDNNIMMLKNRIILYLYDKIYKNRSDFVCTAV